MLYVKITRAHLSTLSYEVWQALQSGPISFQITTLTLPRFSKDPFSLKVPHGSFWALWKAVSFSLIFKFEDGVPLCGCLLLCCVSFDGPFDSLSSEENTGQILDFLQKSRKNKIQKLTFEEKPTIKSNLFYIKIAQNKTWYSEVLTMDILTLHDNNKKMLLIRYYQGTAKTT